MADYNEFIPMYTAREEDRRPREVISSDDWNELWLLNSSQGDHSERYLLALKDYFFGEDGESGKIKWIEDAFARATGLGDMLTSVYDEDGDVSAAGGIPGYVSQHLIEAYSDLPLSDGVADAGSSLRYSKGDHVHPSDSTKVNTDLSNISNNSIDGDLLKDTSIPTIKYEDLSVTSAKIAAEAVTNAKIAAGAVSSMYYATLLAANWFEISPGTGMYATEIAVNGLLATDNPIIDYAYDSTTQPDVIAAQLDAWNTVLLASVPSNGLLDVTASAIPDVNIPIKILCIRK